MTIKPNTGYMLTVAIITGAFCLSSCGSKDGSPYKSEASLLSACTKLLQLPYNGQVIANESEAAEACSCVYDLAKDVDAVDELGVAIKNSPSIEHLEKNYENVFSRIDNSC